MPPGPKVSPAPSAAALPAHTVERWRHIVRRAAVSGADIAQLVQHFAERAFQNKTSDLDTQGSRRRALTQMCLVVNRELTRAQAAREKYGVAHKNELARAYEGVHIELVLPRPPAAPSKRSQAHTVPQAMDGATQASKTSPLAQKITTVGALDAYCASLAAQVKQLTDEMVQIDAVLNRGIQNHQSTVDELSATSVALWQIAQEVLTELANQTPQPHVPAVTPAPLPIEKTAGLIEPGPIVPSEAVPQAGDRTFGARVSDFFKKLGGNF